MRLAFAAVAILICAFAFGFSQQAKAQVVTATPDSLVVSADTATTTKDTTTQVKKRFLKDWSKPAKAAFYSAIIPGGGQYYNKSYWKIPLVYATDAVIAYFIIDNNKKYQSRAKAYRIRTDGDASTVDEFVDNNAYPQFALGKPNDQGTINLRSSRDYFRKYRDLDIILAILAHGLNILEAHVDAHLQGFDISDDLSMQIKPDVQRIPTASYSPMLTLQFNIK